MGEESILKKMVDLQAGHSIQTARACYATSNLDLSFIDMTKFAAFQIISQKWHSKVLGINFNQNTVVPNLNNETSDTISTIYLNDINRNIIEQYKKYNYNLFIHSF